MIYLMHTLKKEISLKIKLQSYQSNLRRLNHMMPCLINIIILIPIKISQRGLFIGEDILLLHIILNSGKDMILELIKEKYSKSIMMYGSIIFYNLKPLRNLIISIKFHQLCQNHSLFN